MGHPVQLELGLLQYCLFSPPLPLLAIIESPLALLNLRAICEFGTCGAKTFKLCALTFGSDDFIALLGKISGYISRQPCEMSPIESFLS